MSHWNRLVGLEIVIGGPLPDWLSAWSNGTKVKAIVKNNKTGTKILILGIMANIIIF